MILTRAPRFAALLTCSPAAPQAPAFDRSGDGAVGTDGDSYGNSASTMSSQGVAPWQDPNVAHAGCVINPQGSRVFRARGGGGASTTTREVKKVQEGLGGGWRALTAWPDPTEAWHPKHSADAAGQVVALLHAA